MHMPLLNEIKLRTCVCAYVGLILAMCMQERGLRACYVLACFLILCIAIYNYSYRPQVSSYASIKPYAQCM